MRARNFYKALGERSEKLRVLSKFYTVVEYNTEADESISSARPDEKFSAFRSVAEKKKKKKEKKRR